MNTAELLYVALQGAHMGLVLYILWAVGNVLQAVARRLNREPQS